MKKEFTTDFQTRLWDAVKSIERDSQAEVVVVLRACSDTYPAIPLVWGICAAWLSHTYMMYAPDFFENWLVYYVPIFAFAISYAFAHLPAIKRLCTKKSTLQKNVEIMARAIFQKGGIHHTRAKTGVLIYCSFLEQSVYILPDRGIEMAIPHEEWQSLRQEFNLIFAGKKTTDRLLTALHKTRLLFGRYLPARGDDINELPDSLEIDL
jgi:putative membrane protein